MGQINKGNKEISLINIHVTHYLNNEGKVNWSSKSVIDCLIVGRETQGNEQSIGKVTKKAKDIHFQEFWKWVRENDVVLNVEAMLEWESVSNTRRQRRAQQCNCKTASNHYQSRLWLLFFFLFESKSTWFNIQNWINYTFYTQLW